jgi:2-oxoglutarate dehydrogenase E2 component (dihydrolipoamide succinyltransferase)
MAVQLRIPEAGESVTEVQIGVWLKSEGEYVERDEPLVELESDKATMQLPAPEAGVLRKILKHTGEVCAVGDVIGEIEEGVQPEKKAKPEEKSGTEPAQAAAEKRPRATASPERPREAPAEKPREARPAAAPPERPRAQPRDDIRVMPAARRLLAEEDLEPGQVEATGPGGRLLKEDVQRSLESLRRKEHERPAPGPAAPTDGRQEEAVPMSLLRRRIAERLVESQRNTATLTTFNEVDMSAVMELREENRERFQEKYGIRLGFMSFFVKASIDALKLIPQVNAEIRGTDIVYRNYYDIGVAVSTDRGLVVPVLRDADRMSFAEVELAIADLAGRARDKKLTPEELQGGTFTISNGGVFGSLLSTPILNYPQSGVLGLHAIQERPVVHEGRVVIRPMMYIALSYDHRIIDGRESVAFLRRVKECIESPPRILLEA